MHRNYTDNASVQVSVFEDRVEITSPGMLYGGVALQKILNGTSKIRNKVLANVFAEMYIIEKWGTEIQRVIDGCREYGIEDPEWIELGTTFRVNIYRPKQLHRHLDRQLHRHLDRHLDRHLHRHLHRHLDRHLHRHLHRHLDAK
jgi:predicted HTH transcriptional regulator